MAPSPAPSIDSATIVTRLSRWLFGAAQFRRVERTPRRTSQRQALMAAINAGHVQAEGAHWVGASIGGEPAEDADLAIVTEHDGDEGVAAGVAEGVVRSAAYHTRILYSAVSIDGQLFRVGDGCLLENAANETRPFTGRILKLWEDEPSGVKMALINWLYRPEETRKGRQGTHGLHELFLSTAEDVNVLASVIGRIALLSHEEFQSRYDDQDRSLTDVFYCRAKYNPLRNTITPALFTSQELQQRLLVSNKPKTAAAAPKKKRQGIAVSTSLDHLRSSSGGNTKKPSTILSLLPPRSVPLATSVSDDVLEVAKARLHASAVPDGLPGRENEFAEVLRCVESAVTEGMGACVYISGVPGTGKTATVLQVIRHLQEQSERDDLPPFDFVELNGMRLTDPSNAYTVLWGALSGKHVSPTHAAELLEKHFSTPNPRRHSCVVLMDELDLLVTRKQTVIYNLFDWPNRKHARLLVIAIANTMDLPERMLSTRVSSRLGLSRVTFEPYTFQQLIRIISSRLEGTPVLDADAIELCARKVASVSGDARRALDVCRRAVELLDEHQGRDIEGASDNKIANISHIDRAWKEMFASSTMQAVRNASLHEKIFLCSVLTILRVTGAAETTFVEAARRHQQMCRMHSQTIPTMSQLAYICSRLGATRVLLTGMAQEDFSQRLRFNLTEDDVRFTLHNDDLVKAMVPV